MEEIWKDIHGFEGSYQISNIGRVRSCDRYDGRGRFIRGRLLNPSLNKGRGYFRIALYDGHRNATHYEIHRLVALHFVPGYQKGLVVNHINEIRTDNRSENLEFCTQQYNLVYSDVIASRRRTVYQYDLEGNYITKFKCCSEVERLFGVKQGTMTHVMYESKTKIWKGYRWSHEKMSKRQWEKIRTKYKTSKRSVYQCDEEGEEIAKFNTIQEAANKVGVTNTAISRCLRGFSKHSAGFKWKYAE